MGPLSKKNNYPKEYCLKEYFLHISMALFLSTLHQLWTGLCTSPSFGWHNPSHGWALHSTESTWFKIISLNFPPQRTRMQGRLRPNGKILYVFAPEPWEHWEVWFIHCQPPTASAVTLRSHLSACLASVSFSTACSSLCPQGAGAPEMAAETLVAQWFLLDAMGRAWITFCFPWAGQSHKQQGALILISE